MKLKDNTIHIIAWVICVILMIALVILVITDRRKYQERIVEMRLKSQAQAEENEKIENANSEKKLEIYNDLISELKMDDYVFWGISEKVDEENLVFPRVFKQLVDQQINSIISESFGSIIEKENVTIPVVAVNNQLVINESMPEVLVRAGVHELEAGEWALIPKEPKPINLSLRDSETGSKLRFALQKEADFGKTVIGDVEGKLTVADDELDEIYPQFSFVRNEEGDSVQVGQGTDIDIESASAYIGNVPVLFFGEEFLESQDSVDDFVADIESLLMRYTNVDEADSLDADQPYVLICTTPKDSELDDVLDAAFEDHYIRNPYGGDKITEGNYKKLAITVYTTLEKQGSFNELKEKITKAEEELKHLEH